MKALKPKSVAFNEKNLLQVGSSKLADMMLFAVQDRPTLKLRVHAELMEHLAPHVLGPFLDVEVGKVIKKMERIRKKRGEEFPEYMDYLGELSAAIAGPLGRMDVHMAYDMLTRLFEMWQPVSQINRWKWLMKNKGRLGYQIKVHRWFAKTTAHWLGLAAQLQYNHGRVFADFCEIIGNGECFSVFHAHMIRHMLIHMCDTEDRKVLRELSDQMSVVLSLLAEQEELYYILSRPRRAQYYSQMLRAAEEHIWRTQVYE